MKVYRSAGLLLSFVASLALVSTAALAASPQGQLPRDSVYQLPLPLTDQHGKTWDWSRHRGQPQVVAMFYASCPNMCPLIIDSGKAVVRALTLPQQRRLQLLYISMDPAHDTPAVLNGLATERKLDPARWSLASPRIQDVRSVAGVLGVRYRHLADGQFNHTSALLLLDRDGRVVARTDQISRIADPKFVDSVIRVLNQTK
jgi:protein SCO1/2